MEANNNTLFFLEYKHPFERGFRTAAGDETRNMGEQLGPKRIFHDTDLIERFVNLPVVPVEANAKLKRDQRIVSTTIEPPVRRRINGNNRAAIL